MKDLSLKSNSRKCQQGIFSIEFAIVGFFFSLLLVFSGDVIIKLSVKGKLDRLSYSLVNVVKERTQLYDSSVILTSKQVDDIDTIARHSLQRTFGNYDASRYGLLVEEQSFSGVGQQQPTISERRGELNCRVAKPISELQHLSVVSVWGHQMPLYRVTLCYRTNNWFGELVGTDFTDVMSDSVVIGR
ncbi:tight adherence pilus pseudopilin TadF [Vibrio coralliirubri]|uniref:tight adherence pilus pseudopilin TadF n=1 Tax=Vibrio TaxID=662 RepID=UPI000769FAE2|nr:MULTISPECIES: tight adherence pilus pseudopilin TadF [Vibrio]MCY9865802.1 tight adherence pilus pseudopilin TadF [Vibrio coralliirubri]